MRYKISVVRIALSIDSINTALKKLQYVETTSIISIFPNKNSDNTNKVENINMYKKRTNKNQIALII